MIGPARVLGLVLRGGMLRGLCPLCPLRIRFTPASESTPSPYQFTYIIGDLLSRVPDQNESDLT